jgi:exosome complex exonuclease DIS3/RRP44
MAQQASRSSVELYTHLFFKGKLLTEEAYVIRVLVNGLVVLVPKYGVEGIVYTSPNPDDPPLLVMDSTANRLVSVDGDATISLFQKVKVQISVIEAGDAAAQRSKLQLRLLEPFIKGMDVNPKEKESAQKKKKQKRG